VLGLSWTGLPSRNLLASSLVSLAPLLLYSGGREDKKADSNSSITPDRLVSPRDLKPSKISSLKTMQTFTLPIPKSISNMPSKVSIDAYTKSIEVYRHMHPYTHKQAIYVYTLISIYEEEEAGVGGRGLEARFLHFGGKGIIVFSYISVEECGKGLEVG
jgi:hypothetical protein